MSPERISELLQPFLASGMELNKNQLNNISIYIDILLKWNARMNLTAVRQPEEIVQRHFGESLFAARQLFPDGMPHEKTSRVLDIGSGAGFPGLPIKIWASQVQLILIESNQKKATFLREVARALTMTDVDVLGVRAENYDGHADVVTLRAVEQYDVVLPIAAEKIATLGRLVLLIGNAQTAKARILAPLQWQEPIGVPGSSNRVLLIGRRSLNNKESD